MAPKLRWFSRFDASQGANQKCEGQFRQDEIFGGGRFAEKTNTNRGI
jgi:hypothetical protein